MIRTGIVTAALLWAAAAGATRPPLPQSLQAAVASSESQTPAELLPREFFLAQPKVGPIRLSPDERSATFIIREGDDFAIRVLDLQSGKQRQRFRSKTVRDLYWSGDSRRLFLETEDGLAAVPADNGRPHLLIRLDEEKEESFLGVDPNSAAAVFVSLPDDGGGYNLYRLNENGERTRLLHTREPVRDLLTDQSGIRFLRLAQGDRQVIFELEGDEKHEVFHCDFLDACALLGLRGDKLLLLSDGNDQNRDQYRRLLQLDSNTGKVTELHRDPLDIASLDAVQIARDGWTPLITSYRSNYRHNYGLGRAQQRVRELNHALAGSDLVIEAHSAMGNWLVREERSDYHHPRYFLLRAGSHKPERILEEFHSENTIENERQLSAKIPFTFTASDGLPIHAYVTLPRGRDLSRTPIIARPHGGPWNRVDSGPECYTQFLANRGYIVYEPNFRASTGYSRDFALAGRGEFGKGRVQQDILDGLDTLLANGIGDAQKQAIVGHSFGGFSAFTGLTFTPERFRAGVASSPSVDLVSSLRDYSKHFDLRANGLRWSQSLGELAGDLDDPHFVKKMRARMPATHAGAIKSPLLVIAGGRDRRVDQRRVKGFVAQLQGDGNDISFLLDGNEGHNFRNPLAREAHFYLTETFLARHLGGQRQKEISEELQRYLRRNLLIAGRSLPANL
ncbi:S9 family peptidase [Microbulbifer rhizosphaerae]|uniref:Dipeptidyl aminopeptidase/acylaminoacyl peptidase n=1 Tax=Microbulbifer rhizosphaerae TaxID=1562603 RepID=A0A7W4Z798_9GAMM|nr:prolyl oligopeptidase family serine peptidase [Microbulbifer rhizosphaerae]MBB3059533.1 dipeptidyl aminopeptidase/acylaminoacyl peptidase [Microbulbifer rhizosphaerae]